MTDIDFNIGWLLLGNMAYGKPAIQGPDTYGDYNASRAVDGNLDPEINAGGSCAHPFRRNKHSATAWWQVDLLQSYVTIGVNITNRSSNRGKWNGYAFISYKNPYRIYMNRHKRNISVSLDTLKIPCLVVPHDWNKSK